ncbi:M1 family metallopeptidase [Fibrivirga algicola]|uniref:M1 family metallopeptidase n=1 Tax=Fibrivirga algicola TaxID=2950420 RepID=A0ABX0QHP3_9BACT|nr:M1 family metallopeptidase [Fibrivirga algicola]NID10378.1 M1 family metallopeptidase [Fibrivirga algicola]
MRPLYLILLFIPGLATALAPPLSPRNANYRINVRLNTDTKRLDGKQTLTWRNTSPEVVRELQFHMYLNAFKDANSTFMRESGGQLRGEALDKSKPENFGWTNLTVLRDQRTGESLLGQSQYIQPDDQAAGTFNPDDRTVLRVRLGRPVAPGETVVLDMAFQAKLPKIFARTGFSKDFFLVGQWFPKIGVYEPAGMRGRRVGGWNCHQFHAHSEFYADYGTYDIAIITPAPFVIGATGQQIGETTHKDGTKTTRWQANDVIDFAWTASPYYSITTSRWQGKSGVPVAIRLLMQPEHSDQAQRHLDAAKAALSYFDTYLGRYPYPTLTIVDPPLRAMGAGGMEYPTFITAGTSWGLPAGMRFPEVVTVHEFGHQYFMQLLASNEFEEAWLDEGFNQYYEGRIMDETYGQGKSQIDWFGFRMGDLEASRDGYVHLDNPAIGPAYGNTWELPAGYYGALTYLKTATWLRTLDGLVGRAVMDEVMQTYFIRWRFKHPNAQSFIDVVNEVVPRRLGQKSGPDMNWFFDQVLFGDRVCDYQLVNLYNHDKSPATIRVDRLGDMQLPVEVLVHFEDGRETTLFWDGQERSRTFNAGRKGRVLWAQVDPYHKLYMDVNVINNSYTVSPSSAPSAKYAAKFLFWIENAMQWIAWLV